MKLRRLWSSLKPQGACTVNGKGEQCGCGAHSGALGEAHSGAHGGSGDEPCSSGPPLRSLPLLQVWPSQDSPRGEADGQSFVYPVSDDSRRGSASALASPLAQSPSPAAAASAAVTAPLADTTSSAPGVSNSDSYSEPDFEVRSFGTTH